MESNDNVRLLFPTCLYTSENVLDKKENKTITNKVLELSNQIEDGGKDWNCNTINSYNVFDLKDDITFENIINIVTEKVNHFANFLNSNYQYQLTESWYNVSTKGSFQEGHVHPRSVFSSVYYPSVPPGSGSFLMYSNENEMYPLFNVTERNDYNSLAYKINPREGLLIIFKSSIRHMVEIGFNEEPRVSLSFNFS